MKLISLIVLAMTAVCYCPIDRPVAEISSFALTAEQKANTTQEGQGTIEITLRNVSARTVSILKHDPISDYSISVKNSKGEAVPLTPDGKRAYSTSSTPTIERTIAIDLGPNESTSDTINVSRYFDMSHPGTYTMKVTDKIEGVRPHRTITAKVVISDREH